MATVISTEYRCIAQCYATAIEYGDLDGLSDMDIKQIIRYDTNNRIACQCIGADNVVHDWNYNGGESFWGCDCISGLYAIVVEVEVNFMGEK